MTHLNRFRIDVALVGLLLCTLGLHTFLKYTWLDTLLLCAAILGTIPVFFSAYTNLMHKEWVSMDMLASIALGFSLVAQEWAPAVFIALMLAAARILSSLTQARTEKSITGLLKLRPSTAKVEKGGVIQVIPLENIVVGDVVIVDLGERIPIDGIVIEGTASVDESSLTGESLPVEKSTGSKVFSSTLIASGNIHVKAEKIGKDTTLEHIIALVESARSEKPETQTMGETFGKVYLVGVLACAIVLFLFTSNISLVLAVVLVVCADDIAVAIPIAYLRGIGAAAKSGVIIKGARHLEVLGKATILVLDKTGTLTKGALTVSSVVAAEGYTEVEVLAAATLAAERSKHPLARAVIAFADAKKVPRSEPLTVDEISGKGIVATSATYTATFGRETFLIEKSIVIPPQLKKDTEALLQQGKSVSFVAVDTTAIGAIAVSDEIKNNAKQALTELRLLGIKKIVMLTGDNEHVARVVATELGLDEFHGGLLPEGKVTALQKLHSEGVVVMVGDGVNDAAALSVAHVGIAMGAMGVDGAIESAEIVLMKDDLMAIPMVVRLAHTVSAVAYQDFWIWGITNVAGLALVFFGLIGITGAAAYNFISDFFPLLNSLRVKSNYVK